MSKSFVSPYGITLSEGGKIDIFPAVEVGLQNKEGEWLSLFFVIDSGAAISALPKSDAAVLGVNLIDGRQMFIGGIAGEILRGWQHTISVRLGHKKIRLPVVFLDSDLSPRVVGRAGVFENYTIIFEESRRRSAFLNEKTKESRKISAVLDEIK